MGPSSAGTPLSTACSTALTGRALPAAWTVGMRLDQQRLPRGLLRALLISCLHTIISCSHVS